MERNPEAVKAMVDADWEVASHGLVQVASLEVGASQCNYVLSHIIRYLLWMIFIFTSQLPLD